MASGSAFQYSTLATLGHPTSSDPLPPSSCSSASSASLFFLYPHLIFLHSLSSLVLSSFLSLSLSLSFLSLLPFSFCLSVSPARLFLPFRSPSSFSAAISSLSDRSSASSFGLRVLLFRSSAFLSFRSPADSSYGLSSLRRHCGRIHSADFIERISLFLFLSLLFLCLSRIPRILLWIFRSYAYFSIKPGD